jgi:hypothetical protein
MRRSLVAALAAALLILPAAPARACDPSWDWWCSWYDPYWDIPAYDVSWWEEPAYVADPVTEDQGWWDPVVWVAPQADLIDATYVQAPTPAPDPVAGAAALGLHFVSEVFTGHVTTTSGDLTTYTSTAAAYDAGTAARLVATVATGETTGYDAVVLGGRTTLSDGRTVAGQIYENYVWSGSEWTVNAYVFFQDDAELARLSQPTAVPAAAVAPIVEPVPAPVPVAAPAPPASATPGSHPPIAVAVAPQPAPLDEGPAWVPAAPQPRVVRAGIALGPQADVLGRVEVLRGRRVPLWVRATVDDIPARVIAWALREGELTALGPVSGSGDEPLIGSWRTLSPRGSAFVLTIRATVEVPGAAAVDVDASVEVVVRSPAVIE